jgi:hypothetical protein
MSKPDDGTRGGTREGFLGDIVDKVKDLLDGPDPEQDPTHLNHPDNRAAPESFGSSTPDPIGQHDSESLSPPPVGGSVA